MADGNSWFTYYARWIDYLFIKNQWYETHITRI